MLLYKYVLCGCVLFLSPFILYSQGCSDAGFCTMGAMKPDQPFNKKIELRLRSMEISFYRGSTPLTPVIYVATADLNFGLTKKTSFQLKLPYQAINGSLGETQGLGDISLCFTRNIISTDKYDINLSVGGKLPSNNSSKTEGDKPLPMYYQTSLGTYDFITGISFINRQWLLATGIQYPFNQNENKFTWSAWPEYPDQDYIRKYAPAHELKRGTDVMVRIERNFRFSRFNFTIGTLPIYRITKDEITRGAIREKVDGTTGLALSGIVTGAYSFNVKSGVKVLVGRKILQRDHNPDGLTRHAVSTISYYYRF